MPCKNEREDRLEVLKQSKEFNPVIEFDVNSPMSSQRTSQPQMNSSRSNSDGPLDLKMNTKVSSSQNMPHTQ